MNQSHSANPFVSEMFPGLLMREQLHRFSNSFQVIAALARQCDREAGTPDTALMVEALHDRMHALATLHRLLATDFEMHNFADRVREISREIVRAFGRTDAITLKIERFWLPEEHRLRLCLIVNELVTNAMKHSLCNCAEGLIEVSARRFDRTVVLTVVDSNRQSLLGRRPLPSPIVAGLAESIGGAAEVIDQNGYAVRVILPCDDQPVQTIDGIWSRTPFAQTVAAGAIH